MVSDLNPPVLQHISWGSSVATFIPHMVGKLGDYGVRQALCAVLAYARSIAISDAHPTPVATIKQLQ
jgi:hypothetical protein